MLGGRGRGGVGSNPVGVLGGRGGGREGLGVRLIQGVCWEGGAGYETNPGAVLGGRGC